MFHVFVNQFVPVSPDCSRIVKAKMRSERVGEENRNLGVLGIWGTGIWRLHELMVKELLLPWAVAPIYELLGLSM